MMLAQFAKLRAAPDRPVELAGYQCSTPRPGGTSGYLCRGRMVATWHVATRVPTVTCDACGRVAAAEVAA